MTIEDLVKSIKIINTSLVSIHLRWDMLKDENNKGFIKQELFKKLNTAKSELGKINAELNKL